MNHPPPLNGLVAFAAILRHGSFTEAARALGLTQSAISYRIQLLETWYGQRLFRRRNPGLDLTPAGRALQGDAQGLLDAIERLHPRHRLRPLRIALGGALSAWWLARRLPGFAEAHPGAAVETIVVGSQDEARSVDADLRLLWLPAGEAQNTAQQRVIVREQVFPVCHPSLLAGRLALADARQVANLPLIHKGRPDRQGREWNWPSWIGEARAARQARVQFDELGSSLAAAAGGAGVALARSLLVADALAEGRLARVLPERFDRPSSNVHVARWDPGARDRHPAARRFVDWLQAAAIDAVRQPVAPRRDRLAAG